LKKIKDLYYCHHCKKIMHTIQELLFIEETNNRGFCSQECIESFYAPVVEYFQNREEELRSSCGLLDESCLDLLSDEKNIEDIIFHPDKTLEMKNQLGDIFTTYIKEMEAPDGKPAYLSALVSLYGGKPSFVYYVTATQNQSLLEELTLGYSMPADSEATVEELLEKGEEGFGTMVVDDTFIDLVERKKSKLLAVLISTRDQKDIPFEKFVEYEGYVAKTMESPDEIYMEVDDEGDKIYKYIKVYADKRNNFYHFVLCTPYEKATKDSTQEESMEALLPILSFPSIESHFIKSMKSGKLISGVLKN
jgi:hypothetical protein